MIRNYENPNIVVIGGGTGNSTLGRELKHYTDNLTAVVNMSDDGGSSGRLMKERGVLSPGDVRQCLAALSMNPEAAEAFSRRYSDGHVEGNLKLADLQQQSGCFMKAIETAASELQTIGRVLPVTTDPHVLKLRYDDAAVIEGESAIGDTHFQGKNPHIWLDPAPTITEAAEDALLAADMIVVAPGNLYRSLLPALAVRGVADALRRTDAQKVMVSNLVNIPGQTGGWHVADYAAVIQAYTGELDTIIYNDAHFSSLVAANGTDIHPIETNATGFNQLKAQRIGAYILSETIKITDGNDVLMKTPRNSIVHNGQTTAEALMALVHPVAREQAA